MMYRFTLGVLLAASALAGCDGKPAADKIQLVSERDFTTAWASTWCSRQKECALADFEGRWTDDKTSSCERAKSEQEDIRTDWKDLVCGEYSARQADGCIEAMRTQSCDDWSAREWRQSCKAVYGC